MVIGIRPTVREGMSLPLRILLSLVVLGYVVPVGGSIVRNISLKIRLKSGVEGRSCGGRKCMDLCEEVYAFYYLVVSSSWVN